MSPALVWGPIASVTVAFPFIEVSSITETSATISWTVIPAATGQIEYGPGSGSYPFTTTLETGHLSNHIQTITGLAAGQDVYFRILGTTAAGVSGTSAEQSFTTDAAGASDFDTGYTYTDYTVPGTVSTMAELQAFVNTVPNGADATHHSRILLGANRVYIGATGRANTMLPSNPSIWGLLLNNRSHLTFEGEGTEVPYGHTSGAILRVTGSTPSVKETSVIFSEYARNSAWTMDDVRFHCLTVEGQSTNYASATAGSGGEAQMGWSLSGVRDVVIDHCISDKCKGDGIYMESGIFSGNNRCLRVTARDSTIKNNGRMGVAWSGGSDDALLEDMLFHDICYGVLDVELDTAGNMVVNGLTARRIKTTGQWSWGSNFNDAWFTCFGLTGSSITGTVLIEDCVMEGSQNTVNGIRELFRITSESVITKTANFTIRNNLNVGNRIAGPIARFGNCSGVVTVTGNTNFLASGSWVSATNTPNLIQSGNS